MAPLTKLNRLVLWGVLALVAVLGLALGYREISSPDIGFHLSTARWIVDNGSVPFSDPLTYTVPGHPYIDLQWLFQLLCYGSHRLGGTTLIVVATTLLTLAFSALLLLRAWRRDGRIPLSAILLVMLFFLGTVWEIRPHLLSWIYGSLILLILEEYGRGSKRWLPLLPVIMILWVNSHSLFVLGLVAIGAYGIGWLRQPRPRDRSFLVWSGAAVLACLVNPYHVLGLLLPLVQLREISGGSLFKSTTIGISEFLSPFTFAPYISDGQLALLQPRLAWQLFAALAIVGLIGGWRKARLPEILLFVAFLYVFSSANKNFGYFAMACVPLVASGLDRFARCAGAALARYVARDDAAPSSPGGRGALVWLVGCGLVTAALVGATWTGRLYDLAWTDWRRGTDFNAAILPVEAGAFLNRHHIEGRLLNTWNDGGYISWATGQPVFIYSNTEVMGSAFYKQYMSAKYPNGFAPALQKWRPTVAVVPFKVASFWLYHLSRSTDWRMVHTSDYAAVFLHRTEAPRVPALPRPQAGTDYRVFDGPTARTLILNAAAAPEPDFWEWLQGSGAYPMREMSRATFYFLTGELDACIGVALEGIEKTPFLVRRLMLRLGHAFNARGDYDNADVCFDAFLRGDADPVVVQEIQRARARR